MRKFFIFILLILAIPSIVIAQDQQEDRVTVRLTKPIIVPTVKDVTAEFVDMTEEAQQMGLDAMQIHGTASYPEVKLTDGSQPIEIKWHSASSTTVNNVKEALVTPLRSSISSSSAMVNVGETFVAIGNLDQLAQDLQELDEAAEEKEKAVSEKETEKTATVGGLAPSQAAPQSTSEPSTPTLTVEADLQSTTYEECDPFIDEGALQVWKQRKTIVSGESGKVYSTSMCENYDKLADIKKRPGECGYQFEFESGFAKAMEQWYYIDSSTGEETLVGDCRESGNKIEIESRCDQTYCPDYFDEANGLVFPQCSKGIMVGETWFPAPSGCQPQDGVSYSVEWEYVINDNGTADVATDDYITTHDDFTNGISYPMIRKFYTHPVNGKTYLTEAVQSATESYPHKHETSLCEWVMDDEKLQAQQMSNTYIETPKGTRELQECAARTAPVPYAYIGLKEIPTIFNPTGEWQEFTPPEGITKLKVTAVAGGDNGGKAYRLSGAGKIPAFEGGWAGQIVENFFITISEGETIPVFPGQGGTYTSSINKYGSFTLSNQFCVEQGCQRVSLFPAENTIVGKDTSSFSPITARTHQTSGLISSVAETGGAGANGYLFGETYPVAGNGYNWDKSRPVSFDGLANRFGFGGLGGTGYGAGGGGAPSSFGVPGNAIGLSEEAYGGAGAPGVVIIKYNVMRYLRPNGTQYDVLTNEF